MRIIFAGDWFYPMYEAAFGKALDGLGATVIPFPWHNYFLSPFSRLQLKYLVGPAIGRLNQDLINLVNEINPDVVFIWLGTPIISRTLCMIKRFTRSLVVGYVHDDPFAHRLHKLSYKHHRWYWREFIKGLPYYDIAFFSKQLNIDEAYYFGAKRSELLRQYFVPEIHRPYKLSIEEKQQFGCDVAFAGHFEPDGRDKYIQALIKANLHVQLYADKSWKRKNISIIDGDFFENFQKLPRVSGENYAKALNGASMSLCFLSKMNRDQYTTRCFEIPACGSLLLSERTADLQRLFREDEEAIFFSSVDELVEKALWLKSHPEEITCIAAAGMRRVHTDSHSVNDRARQFIDIVEKVRSTGYL